MSVQYYIKTPQKVKLWFRALPSCQPYLRRSNSPSNNLPRLTTINSIIHWLCVMCSPFLPYHNPNKRQKKKNMWEDYTSPMKFDMSFKISSVYILRSSLRSTSITTSLWLTSTSIIPLLIAWALRLKSIPFCWAQVEKSIRPLFWLNSNDGRKPTKQPNDACKNNQSNDAFSQRLSPIQHWNEAHTNRPAELLPMSFTSTCSFDVKSASARAHSLSSSSCCI